LNKYGGKIPNTSSVDLSSSAQSALRKAAKKVGLRSIYSSGRKHRRRGKKESDFDFSLGNSRAGRKGINTSGFMEKKYKYKQGDIVKNSGASIFQIISNRYQQSALERLFPDE
jgi:hypothetical protein